MTIDYETITAFVSILAVFLTLVALIAETRRSRLTLQTQLLLGLQEKMDSADLRDARKTAANNLLSGVAPNYELGDVLDFFATIAFLYERQAIDRDLTYKQFSWWVVRWWLCAADWVKMEREMTDPTGWKTLERVSKDLMKQEKKEGYPPYTSEMLRIFLHEEARKPLDMGEESSR